VADEFAVEDREGLAKLLEGQSDEQINEVVGPQVDTVLDQVFGAMKQAFQADKAAGQSAVVQWDITAPDGLKTYQFKVDDGKCEVTPGAVDSARVTLGLALPDFLRFVAGQLDGMQAFMSGKLRLAGDMMFATTLQTWFNT
jgi:putative sterol carrier protein